MSSYIHIRRSRSIQSENGPFFYSEIEKIAKCLHFAKQNAWIDVILYKGSFVYAAKRVAKKKF